MNFDTLLKLVGDEPVFESSFLLSGDVNPQLIRQQLSRWVKSGRIYQLRRRLYAITLPDQKKQPPPFLEKVKIFAEEFITSEMVKTNDNLRQVLV